MYYINAEHPFTVLYRYKRAVFIENKTYFHKIGMPDMEGTIFIQTLQLLPGDVIIAGSDGRDELFLGIDERGNSIINENEGEFLKRVEEGDGDLWRIFRRILRYGRLTDDISLLRISYSSPEKTLGFGTESPEVTDLVERAKALRKNGKANEAVAILQKALNIEADNAEVLYELTRTNIERHDFALAAARAERYVNLRPGDTEMIYIASVCFRKAGRTVEAADLGERVRLRNPSLAKNLINLAKIYVMLKNPERAENMVNDALEVEPDHPIATKIKGKIAALRAKRASAQSAGV